MTRFTNPAGGTRCANRAITRVAPAADNVEEGRRVGKAKRAHQGPPPGGHGVQERAFAHPTSDSS